MQSPETGEQKSSQELLEMNTLHDNEAFLEALAAATSFEDVRDIIHDQTRVIKKNREDIEIEDEEFDYVIGHVHIDAEGKKAVQFFHREELLELVDKIEMNPSWAEQDIVTTVEHTSIADALIRIAANQ